MVRLLRAIVEANLYMVEHPKEAKPILQKRHSLDAGYADRIWQRTVFALRLDQSLITATEDEARWMISNGLTTEKQVPDFMNYIYEGGLEALKSDVVNIIR
jgi:hypothetical protein